MVFASILYHAEHYIALFFVTKNQILLIGRRNGSHSKHAMKRTTKLATKLILGFLGIVKNRQNKAFGGFGIRLKTWHFLRAQ